MPHPAPPLDPLEQGMRLPSPQPAAPRRASTPRRRRWRTLALVLGLHSIAPAAPAPVVTAEHPDALPPVSRRLLGHPPLQTFSTRDGAIDNFAASAWTRSGLLVVAQGTELLEFDGRSWRVVGAGGPSDPVSAITSKTDDRIYVAGFEDVGYYAPDEHGRLRFSSIKHEMQGLKAPLRWLAAQHGDTLYFRTPSSVIAHSPLGTREWPATGTVSGVWPMGDRVFVADGAAGFLELTAKGLRPAPGGGEHFTDDHDPVAHAALLADETLVLGTRTKLYRYDGNAFTPLAHPPLPQILALKTTPDGGFVAQFADGLDIFGPDLRYRGTLRGLDRILRLAPRTVLTHAPDGLWLGSASGLVRLDTGNLVRSYAEEAGLSVPVTDLFIQDNRLVARTNRALSSAPLDEAGLVEPFSAIPLSDDYVAATAPTRNGIAYIGASEQSRRKFLRTTDSSFVFELPETTRGLHGSTEHPDSVLYATTPGRGDSVYRLTRENNRLRVEMDWLRVGQFIFGIEEDTDGTVWLNLGTGRIAHARPPFRPEDIAYYDHTHGVPSGWFGAFRLGRKMIFETHHGIHEFDRAAKRFFRSPLNDRLPPELAHAPRRTRIAGDHQLWINGRSSAALITVDDEGRWLSQVVIPFADRHLNHAIYQHPGVVWISTPTGLLRVDTRAPAPSPRPFSTSVRSITAIGEKQLVVFGGGLARPASEIRLPFSQNTLELRLAADCWDRPEASAFQHRAGDHADWSPWSTHPAVVLPALPPGRHRFEFRSRSADGRLGAPVAFSVLVAPPWYRTWWAYAGWSLAALASLAASGWLASITQRRRARALEAAVDARTAVIAHQAAEIQQQNARLLQAEHEREMAHRQFVAASRQAGMAEVAASVLHNVGNALNSISTSATLARDAARHIEPVRVARAAEAIAANPEQFPGPKAQKLRAFLEQIAATLARQQALVESELARVREGIEHVESVINAQQRLAVAPNLRERIPVQELVDAALRLSLASFQRHGVHVDTDLPPDLPPLDTDKHKVLQILVNLLANARHACDEDPKALKRVVVRARRTDPTHLRIEVEDNGGGIRPEHRERLFQSGFTTRPGGNGLGLHSSALAAKQLGGALTAHSDGSGQGARFELTLPIGPTEP